MRRIFQFSILCLAVGLVNGCTPDEVIPTEDIPTAGVRFIHAVPDTGALDFRPVDIVENSTFYGVAFRSVGQVFYKNARAGARHFKIFLTPDQNLPAAEQQAMAETVIQDINVTLEAGHRYTFLLWGYARPGSSPAMQLTVLDDDPGDPGAQVALRVVNAAVGRGALDVSYFLVGGSAPGTPTWAAVPELGVSTYVRVDPGEYRYNVTQAAGGFLYCGTPVPPPIPSAPSPNPCPGTALAVVGAPANTVAGLQPLPGTTQAGSAVTGFVFPAHVAGSKAPAFRSTTGSVSLSATATGYARATGSFLINGFVVGDTITVTGFTDPANNGQAIITAVTATTLTVSKTPATVAQAAAGGRTITAPRPGIEFFWDRRPPNAPGF